MSRAEAARSCFRSALTRLDVIIVVGTFAILIVLFILTTPRWNHNGVSHRSVCAANLKGMGTGYYTYANENNDMWPNCGPAKTGEPGSPRVTYAPGLIGKNRDLSDAELATRPAGEDLQISNTRNLWMLVRLKIGTQSSFVCDRSQDTPNKDKTPERYWDFRSYGEISYGYQVPFGKLGQPSSNLDLRMPLAADKGPFGAALEAGKPKLGPPTVDPTGKNEVWKPWNSPNHSGEGQNVLFVDGHVDWAPKPTVGVKDDNIYTRWILPTSDPATNADNPLARIHGLPPTGTEVPAGDTDTLIYP